MREGSPAARGRDNIGRRGAIKYFTLPTALGKKATHSGTARSAQKKLRGVNDAPHISNLLKDGRVNPTAIFFVLGAL